MLQASDVKWQIRQVSGASIFNDDEGDDEGDDGDSEEQSEPAETAERPSAAKVQVVSIVTLQTFAFQQLSFVAIGGLCCGRCTL